MQLKSVPLWKQGNKIKKENAQTNAQLRWLHSQPNEFSKAQ